MAQNDSLPSSLVLADGEEVLSVHTFRFSIFAFWLQTIIVRTSRRIHTVQPIGLFNLFGKETDDIRLEQISAVRAKTDCNRPNFIVGTIFIVFCIFSTAEDYGVILPVACLVLGVVLVIESFFTHIQVGSTGTKIKVSLLDRTDAEEAMSTMATSLLKADSSDSETTTQSVVKTDSTSNLDELEKLSSLRDRGIITEDEFDAKKKELLGL